jgi:alpha-galactosidase
MHTPGSSRIISRRQLLCGTAAALPLLQLPGFATPATGPGISVDLFRQPDSMHILLGNAEDAAHKCERSGDSWSAPGVEVAYTPSEGKGTVVLRAPSAPIRRLHLRWNVALSNEILVLGDAWERSYGDLAWLPIQPERPLPWYCLLQDANSTFGMGVATGASAFAFWQVDAAGISLWLDVRNGGNGVVLKDRTLTLASVVTARSDGDESAFETTRKLCRRMVAASKAGKPARKSLAAPLFGSNDWYYAYGQNTAEGILRDADLVRELSPAGPAQPYAVIDDGYQDKARFPDMQKLAGEIRKRGVNPGIWVRPLRAAPAAKPSLLLPASRYGQRRERAGEIAFDPTIPEARTAVLDVFREAMAWGYDLIKHDFSTYELLGQWGNEMGPSPTVDGWSFQDRGKTNAEIIAELYRDIRATVGEDRLLIGCNTVGHLSAGIFDGSRTGDDVSGRNWERTRRMGVNTLGFRLPQNGVFFATDADCVPITSDIPWSFTEQWLRAVAESGSILLISPQPGAIGAEQKRAIRAAFSQCASDHLPSVPADWIHSRTPEDWTTGSSHRNYAWLSPDGASPFSV